MNIETNSFLHNVLSINMVDYLKKLGLEKPEEDMNAISNFTTYISPFWRNEELAPQSLMFVDPLTNHWFCPGSALNGNLIDFGTKYFRCSVPAFLDRIKRQYNFSTHVMEHPGHSTPDHFCAYKSEEASATIKNRELLRLLQANHLPVKMVSIYCQQHTIIDPESETKFNALVLKGDPNPNHFLTVDPNPKSTIAQRHIEWIRDSGYRFTDRDSDQVDVFTSLMDLLHANHLYSQDISKPHNILLLNDIFAFEKARSIMERHDHINLYLENDAISNQYKGYAAWLSPAYRDFSGAYKGFRTLSDKRFDENKQIRNRKSQGL